MKKIHSTYPLFIVSLTILLLMVCSCVKVDSLPSLEISVVDEFNNPVDQALVGIFQNIEEWGMRENPLQAWKKTGVDGKVLFVNLIEQDYYILAEKATLNNLRNEFKTTEVLQENRIVEMIIHID